MTDQSSSLSEAWEKEVLARHRWGQQGDRAREELSRLRLLWNSIHPVDDNIERIIDQIIALEICNWNLEESILALCVAIGSKRPTELKVGHMASMSEERWKMIWTYYATLRDWLVSDDSISGYRSLLRICDPDRTVQDHILRLLGDRTPVKELYIERFCLFLEFAFRRNDFPHDSVQLKAHAHAASVLEEEIRGYVAASSLLRVLDALTVTFHEGYAGYPGLELCHHKLFRRFDIILSSIGVGKWRAAMPMKGIDGFDRADILESYLLPIEMWTQGRSQEATNAELSSNIFSSLGRQDDTTVFLASLLLSLLRSQQVAARQRAERRAKKASS
ncbi:MAG: hypothetical protein JSV16_07245 [Candidatus Hydrogenedentota bacterium]|nr:MAG: hypothetical protein JSV16_07245 [Candidatus Hydrogenedentota bacterium]